MYTYEGMVRYSECDKNGNLTLVNLINYLQDCSTFHSEQLGRGIQFMTDRGIAWLIAAWQIEIDRLPRFCDEICVSTWCHTMKRSAAYRNFTISDTAGNQLVRANSQWFVYDFANGRPIRIPDEQHVLVTDEAPLDMPPMERRLKVVEPYEEAPSFTVSELYLDSNRHVNNAQYLGMAANAIADVCGHDGGIQATDIGRISVYYRQQALLGDTIVPRVHVESASITVDLASPAGETHAVVRIDKR